MIYEGSPAKYLPGLAAVIVEKLKENNRCLYLNAPAMVAGMRSYLAAAGLDVSDAVRKGALVLSSDQGHLINGRFDPGSMLDMLKDAVSQALSDGYKGLWATGDMTWELGDKSNFSKVLEYEFGLERLFQTLPALGGLCQYHTDTLPADVVEKALYTHRAVYISQTLSSVSPYYMSLESVDPRRPKVPIRDVVEMLKHQPLGS